MTKAATMRSAPIVAATSTITTPLSSAARAASVPSRAEGTGDLVAEHDLLVQGDRAAPEAGLQGRRPFGDRLDPRVGGGLAVGEARAVAACDGGAGDGAAAGLV